MKQRKMRMMIKVILIMFSVLSSGCKKEDVFYVKSEEVELNRVEEEPVQAEESNGTAIYIQVCGAVNSPGIYSLEHGSRIFEVIELAGGLTKDAELSALNQAQQLEDGQMVYVYTKEEVKDTKEEVSVAEIKQKEDGKININTASKEELMTLPGIGEAKAGSIISFREESGSFAQVEDIMNITGIKEGVFSKIKDDIKVK